MLLQSFFQTYTTQFYYRMLMKRINKWALLLPAAMLLSQMATAQITETGEAQKTQGNLMLHTLTVANKTAQQPVAVLYFYRSYMSKIVAPLKKMSLYVNDTLIYELKANGVVSYPVYHAGKFKISGDSKDKTSMIVNIKPGGEYFFNCWLPTSIFDPPMQVVNVHPDLARKEIGLPAKVVNETANLSATTALKDSITWNDTAATSVRLEARFPGGADAWARFLQENLNTKLGKKYLSLPKNEYSVTQVVKVSFLVDKSGNVTEVKVDNPAEVHPKLAEEAMRVISKSPQWKPATINGQKVLFLQKQSIAFVVDRG